MSAPVAPPPAPRPHRRRSRAHAVRARLHRRRRRERAVVALILLAVVATIAGAAVGAGTGQDGPAGTAGGPDVRPTPSAPPRAVDRLSLEQQVGQTLVLSFDGAEAPDYVLDALRERRVAGVVLFGDNVVSREQLRSLTRELQQAAGGRAIISVDQEGGSIRQVPWAAPSAGQSALTGAGEVAAAAGEGASDLRRFGLNVNLAPIVDVSAPGGSAVGGRAYPGDAAAVAQLAAASVRSHLRRGVMPTPKHFPGFGLAQANTDDEPVTIDAPREQLLRSDLEPFRAVIEAGAPLVMSSHALYPALDPKRIASQSPPILDGLLRRRLGFRGAVVTDSLEADAVLSRSSVATAGVRSLSAGADLLLMTGAGSYEPVRDRVLARARRSPSFRRRVEDSAQRVLALGDGLRRRAAGSPPSAR